MQNNNPNHPRQNHQHGSIDGLIVQRPRQKRIASQRHRLSQTPVGNSSIQSMSQPSPKAATTLSNESGQQPTSLLNTTIPGTTSGPLKSDLRPNKKKRFTRKRIIVSSVLVVAAIILGTGGFLGVRALHTLDKVFHGNIFSDIGAAFSSSPLKGENTGRVNILLAGDSSDQPGHGGADLTDSILLLSVDTQNHTAFLLSIPRDLWVNQPGVGWEKINAANNDVGTNFSGYPQNGMGQLEHIVTTDLGIPTDYYALSDYGAFEDAVNAVGGVTVDIQSPDPRGLYDPGLLTPLSNGSHFLNGQTALDLARARGDQYGSYGFPDSDFDRTEHQRQIFTAIVEKAKTIGVLSNPVKISNLFNAFSNNVETSLSLQNVLRLVSITKGINLSTIKSYAYCSTLTMGQDGCTNPILSDYTLSSGEEAFIPTAGIGEYGQLKQYYEQLTSNNPIVKEGASVVVLNASNAVGLAKSQESILESKNVYVSSIADANNEYPGTMIVNNSNGKDPNTLKLLEQLYPGTVVTNDNSPLEATEAQGYTANFVIVLGQNWDTTTAQ